MKVILLEPEDRMTQAFNPCYDRLNNKMSSSNWKSIENHKDVAY